MARMLEGIRIVSFAQLLQAPAGVQLLSDLGAETIKMSELAFWSKFAAQTRDTEAKAIADMLTKLFVNMVGAEYEKGHNYASAVVAMSTILSQAGKTVCELAADNPIVTIDK